MTLTVTGRSFGLDRPAVTRQLNRVEARRMLLHPAYAVALAATALSVATIIFGTANGLQRPVNATYGAILLLGTMYYPLATVVAAHRITGSTIRRSVQEAMATTPTHERQRTLALCLGVLTGPALVGVGIMLLAAVVGPFLGAGDGFDARTLPELLQIPVTVLGGGLLGVALARWVPFPGVLALTVLGLWFGHFALATAHSADNSAVHGIDWFALMPTWLFSDATMLARSPLPQELCHLVYLVGLSLLAGIAALVHAPGRRRPLLLTGAGVAVVTAAAAVLQLG